MTRFEPWNSAVGIDHSTNWATTTFQNHYLVWRQWRSRPSNNRICWIFPWIYLSLQFICPFMSTSIRRSPGSRFCYVAESGHFPICGPSWVIFLPFWDHLNTTLKSKSGRTDCKTWRNTHNCATSHLLKLISVAIRQKEVEGKRYGEFAKNCEAPAETWRLFCDLVGKERKRRSDCSSGRVQDEHRFIHLSWATSLLHSDRTSRSRSILSNNCSAVKEEDHEGIDHEEAR